MVSDERLPERDARFRGISDGGGNARVRHWNNHVGFHSGFFREQASQIFAGFLNGTSEDNRIGPRKIDVLKNALRSRRLWRPAFPGHSFGADANHFAWLDVIFIIGVDQVESTGFRGKYVR